MRVLGVNIRNDSGVIETTTWDCSVDNISTVGPRDPHFTLPMALNNCLLCSQNNLVDGPHTLTINVTVAQAQTFWFDDIRYVPSANDSLEHAAVEIDALDPQLQYGPGWKAYNENSMQTQTTNSIFTYSFIGASSVLFTCIFMTVVVRCISELVWLHSRRIPL